MEGYDHTTYGERFAPVYDDWYDGITDARACAALVAELADRDGVAGGGPVLELGVGTGRLAIPIAELGVHVVGVDSSPAMLDALTAKVGDASVSAVIGDMAAPPLDNRMFSVVLVAYNTLFNLVDPSDQQECLNSAARCLLPGGSLLVEAFVPTDGVSHGSVTPRAITADRVVLSVSQSDPVTQEALGQYVDITSNGISLRPWHIRWSTPLQLDEMAAEAGLVLVDRWSDWARAPFDEDSLAHISRYQRS